MPDNSKAVGADEDAKHAKFRQLAENRTNRAIEAISRIGNLSNRQVYEYGDAEVSKIVRALRSAIAEVETRFKTRGKRVEGKFRL